MGKIEIIFPFAFHSHENIATSKGWWEGGKRVFEPFFLLLMKGSTVKQNVPFALFFVNYRKWSHHIKGDFLVGCFWSHDFSLKFINIHLFMQKKSKIYL